MELYWDEVIKSLKYQKAPEYILEDVALIGFTKAFEKLDTYKSEYSFKTWVLSIVNNTLIDYYRKSKSATVSLDQTYTDSSGNEIKMDFKANISSPEELLIDLQEEDFVKDLIEDLPENYSEVLKLRYLLNRSYKEISQELDIPLNNVKVRIMRGRKLLVEMIEASGEIE